jgi:hypothetical protein
MRIRRDGFEGCVQECHILGLAYFSPFDVISQGSLGLVSAAWFVLA